MQAISELFHDFDKVMSGEIGVTCNKPVLILAISARTGSTQLCSVLESMGVFCNTDEILNPRGVVQNILKRDGAKSFVEYLEKLTNNDIPCFSFKTSWSDFKPVSPAYRKIFPNTKFVFLDRFDIVAQAFSLYKAIETGHWHSSNNAMIKTTELFADEINAEHLQSLMQALMHEKFQWEKFFFTNKLVVQHIYYEIIKDDWVSTAKLIAEQFGFHDQAPSSGRFSRLSRESDERLIAQFKKDHGYSWVSV